ncbi:MAG: GGDEF domain-containing protein, partial [Parahaliea sp.]
MALMLTENQAFLVYGLIFTLTCAQILIVYFLSESSVPVAGLGMFTVYFMAALLSWILFALKLGPAMHDLSLMFTSVAAMVTSYLFYLACCQRANTEHGRYLLGILCIGTSFGALFLSAGQMLYVQLAVSALCWTCAGLLSGWRAWRRRNAGDAIVALAGLLMLVGLVWIGSHYASDQNVRQAQSAAFAIHTCAYVLVIVGFLGSVLLEYQQHLSQLSTLDPLTLLFNRRGMEDALQLSLASASRHSSRTAAVLVGIDHFHELNSSFGPEQGDQVIRQLADYLRDHCRGCDVLARVATEEFLLVMPNTDGEAARQVAERLCEAIGRESVQTDPRHYVDISLSAGV